MPCNIDARGKVARLVWGVLLLLLAGVGAGLLLAGVLAGWGWWVGVGALALLGGFGVYEARRGWCVMRAMGVKTPM